MSIKSPWATTHHRHVYSRGPRFQADVYPMISLPSSEPVTPQFQWTVSSSDFAKYDPPMLSFENEAFVLLGVYNNTGTTRTVNYTIYKNGSPLTSGTTNISNTYATTLTLHAVNIVEGDVFDCKLWESTGSGVELFHTAYQCYINRFLPNTGIVLNVGLSNIQSVFDFVNTQYSTVSMAASFHCMYTGDNRMNYDGGDSVYTMPIWEFKDGTFMWEGYYSYYSNRQNTVVTRTTSASTKKYCPYIYSNDIPFVVEYDVLNESAPISTLVEHIISYPSVTETDLRDNITTLPSSKPLEPQFTYTVVSGDHPTITPPVAGYELFAVPYISVGNGSGGSATVSGELHVNGVQIHSTTTGSSSSAFFTMFAHLRDVQVGDVIEIYLWSASSNMVIKYSGIGFTPNRIVLKSSALLYNLILGDMVYAPYFYAAGSQPYSPARDAGYRQWYVGDMEGHWSAGIADQVFGAFESRDDYFLIRAYYGDYDGKANRLKSLVGSVTPYYQGMYTPTKISYRVLNTHKGE